MPTFPPSPQDPADFLEGWLAAAFSEVGPPPGSESVELKLGIELTGDGGGEWVVHVKDGSVSIGPMRRDDAAFTYVQSVEDWRGALWEGRGGPIGVGASQFFKPGDEAPAAAGALGGAPTAAALGQMEQLDGLIRMTVTGGETGDWSVGFRLGPGPIPEEPTTGVFITQQDADALGTGELDPMTAFMSGKMRVEGDMTLMMQMQAIQMAAAQQAASGEG